jgi:hypothetical protein
MPTVPIVFSTSHFPGLRTSEGAGRLYNCYAEPIGESGRSNAVRHRAPGLVNWGTTSDSGFRGAIEVAGVQYVAFGTKLDKFTSTAGGASASVGTLNGTKKGFFARNNASTPDKWFVDPDGNIAVFTPTTVTNSWPDINLPSVNSTCSIDGYGVFTTGDGKAFATGLNATSVNALSFGTAEAKPDGLTRGINWNGRLYLMGPQTIEIWTDQGLTPFPFARIDVISLGIAGPYCVTGHEDNFGKGLFIVGSDNAVYQIVGNAPTKISPPDLDGLIEAVSDKTTIEMCCYISRGHAFIQISCANWSWVYDMNTSKWHERPSYLALRSRITQAYYSFGLWLCGDTKTGNIQKITNAAYDEVGSPLPAEAWSTPVQNFPARLRVATMWFDFAVGVGIASGTDPTQTDPSVEISWSDDGGQTFHVPAIRKLGRQSTGRARVRVNQCGVTGSQGRIVKVRVSDPVHFGLMSGMMSTDLRAA